MEIVPDATKTYRIRRNQEASQESEFQVYFIINQEQKSSLKSLVAAMTNGPRKTAQSRDLLCVFLFGNCLFLAMSTFSFVSCCYLRIILLID
jgi:hypothetical protein